MQSPLDTMKSITLRHYAVLYDMGHYAVFVVFSFRTLGSLHCLSDTMQSYVHGPIRNLK